jgi:vanillate O-demethylase ferredoxin subunit
MAGTETIVPAMSPLPTTAVPRKKPLREICSIWRISLLIFCQPIISRGLSQGYLYASIHFEPRGGMSVLTDRFPMQVISRDMLTAQIASFELAEPRQQILPPFEAGAHIEVDVRPGLLRRYSLCGDPNDRSRYRIAVQRDPHSRGGSQAIHENWRVGDLVTASAPRNNFPLAIIDAPTILIAGGIGITPLLAMAFELTQRERPFELHYAARSSSHMAFRQQLADSPFWKAVRFYFDDGPPEQRFSIERLVETLPRNAHVYVCGPAGLNAGVMDATQRAGFPNQHLHQETFAVGRSGADNRPFTVEIARTRQQFDIPADHTILEVLNRNGVFIPSMCRQGICGICITNVLSGQIDHRDNYLAPDERAKSDVMLPCCSRTATHHVVLDL